MRKHPVTPFTAVVGGLLAGAVGTASMDAVRYYPVDVPFHRAAVVGQDQPRGDGVLVASQTHDEGVQAGLIVDVNGGHPSSSWPRRPHIMAAKARP